MVRALYSGTRDHPLPDAFNYSHSAWDIEGNTKECLEITCTALAFHKGGIDILLFNKC